MDVLDWAELKLEIKDCTKCRLCKTRKNTVFGMGNPAAGVLIIGEGPGQQEDEQGLPFVGRSGQLLDKILEACGFNRNEHVFIGNIVKCRPPENRDPKPDEREACIGYLLKQIDFMQPKIIVLLGRTALQGLIDPQLSITRLRGTWLEWNGIQVLPTYHPSALLRNPNLKKDAWDDFRKLVAKYIELIAPDFRPPYYDKPK